MYFRGIGGLGRCFGNIGGYFHSGWGLVMMGIWLLVIALVIVTIVKLLKKHAANQSGLQNDESMEILNTRFVKGEISEEEYTRIKRTLTGK